MSQTVTSRDVWVVVPAFNETHYLPKVLRKLRRQRRHFIVVDDGSHDSTAEVARTFTSHVISHRINLGKGAALRTGCDYVFQHCHAKAVVLMDGDDQHDAAELEQFIRALQGKNSVVFGARSINTAMPLVRSFWNKFASLLVRVFFGTYIPDIPSGYKAFTRQAYQQLCWTSQGYTVEMEIAARVAKYRLPFTVVPIRTIYHDYSKGMTLLDVASIFTNMLNWKVSL